MDHRVVPTNPSVAEWQALKEQATLAQRSGLLPKSVDTPEKAIVIAMMGRELGLTPMAALTGIYVVNGMATVRGSLMLRLIYERCPGARITVLTPPEKATQECEVEMQRPNAKPMRFKFTVDDAKRAGFMGKPVWQQHTATMLRWAAIRTGARVVFADAISGVYLEDEVPGSNPGMEDPAVLVEPETQEPTPELKALMRGESKDRDVPQVTTLTDKIGHSMDEANQPVILPAQRKKIFEAAELAGITKDELQEYIDKHFGVRTTHALTLLNFNKLMLWLNGLIEAQAKSEKETEEKNVDQV